MAAPSVCTTASSDVALTDKTSPSVHVTELSPIEKTGWIIQSPYLDKEHLLDLGTLDFENAVLAEGLTKLVALREDYATAPYAESFNWSEIMQEVKRNVDSSGGKFKKTSFYVVAFRSQIKPSTEVRHLAELDKGAHAEAVASGGFLKYWFGAPDESLRNLATCIWRSREDALTGGRGPAHRKAAGSTRALYASWKIDQHRLTIFEDANGWELTPWAE